MIISPLLCAPAAAMGRLISAKFKRVGFIWLQLLQFVTLNGPSSFSWMFQLLLAAMAVEEETREGREEGDFSAMIV